MNLQEELQLYCRYKNIFEDNSKALIGIASVHLAQQLERYISPTLDLGWVLRCILDINSDNLFSNARVTDEELVNVEDNSIHPEYKYAAFIIKLCTLFLIASESKTLTTEEVKQYILSADSEFYFGEKLSELNRELVESVCPELTLAI